MLPKSLLLLLLAAPLALSAALTPLTLNNITALNTLRLPNPPAFSIPPPKDNTPLFISVALCSDASPAPRFTIAEVDPSASSDDNSPPQTLAGSEIVFHDGEGSYVGSFPNGAVLTIDTNGATPGVPFEVGVSDTENLHAPPADLPLFGDTTSNQALLFSAPFLPLPDVPTPQYPNYTLPAANMSQPPLPSSSAAGNLTLILTPTSAGLGLASSNRPRTGCFLSSQKTTGTIVSQKPWARDARGWRMQWLVEGLIPQTNYTAYVVHDSAKVSGPIFFATKSAAFPCPLVHSLPYCPSIAYAVPLPQPPGSNAIGAASAYDATTLPEAVSTPLLSYLANFTTVLTTFACGRDWYSPLMGCDDCQREYRAWLCSISFTRCSEPSPANPNGFTATPAGPGETGGAASIATFPSPDGSPNQIILSALLPIPTRAPLPPRNPFLPALSPPTPYTALLPCLEQCHAVDRACPPFIGFKCPSSGFNAGASYGVGYVDGREGDKGSKGRGVAGVAGDRWGNVWCGMV
ncbi:hypothetical protein GALMADRAFT_74770 [Galerina marginata CBS 339.88]|uniref:FZ domain-containing protein n=1 Tax=Galerina marginata (strain CBS 339.88) TaxID=685588 RepID=A0A067SL85_GALM3|nr:hypothetical protein GALMADRAFT_74770 [Galerina marginata CBS 339.88]